MMRAAFDRRRLTIHTMLNDIEGWYLQSPEAFYAFPSVEGVLGRDIRGQVAHTSAS